MKANYKLTELKSIAEKATPGPWVVRHVDETCGEDSLHETVSYIDGEDRWVCTLFDADMVPTSKFIAAFNPSTALQLIEALSVTREALDYIAEDMAKTAEKVSQPEYPEPEPWETASAALEKLKELGIE